MVTNAKGAIRLAEIELRAEGGLVGDELPMAVNFAGIFDSKLERFLISDKDVANVHFCDGELSLGALTLTSKVEG